MDYTLETAERIAQELRAIPAKDPSQRRLDKQGMVRHLASEILALQERGFTLEEVAESLRGSGLDITTPTLKNYLQRAKAASSKAKRARKPSRPRREESKPVSASPASESGRKPPATGPRAAPQLSPAPDAALRTGKGAFLIKDQDSY